MVPLILPLVITCSSGAQVTALWPVPCQAAMHACDQGLTSTLACWLGWPCSKIRDTNSLLIVVNVESLLQATSR